MAEKHGGTFGAYGFVTADWKEKDLPLDLWLEWTLGLFDRVALSLYGDVSLPKGFERNPKLKLIRMEQPLITSFRFSTAGKAAAQEALGTDWKMALDVDEFLPKRPDTSRLNRKYAYPILYHHLYGNANTEIHEAFPRYKYVIHHGSRTVTGDGANVGPPYYVGFGLRALNRIIGTNPKRIFKIYNPPVPPIAFELWHTGATRDPKALSMKWRIQTEREISNGLRRAGFLRFLGNKFDFRRYRGIWPKSYLTHVPDESLPRIIRENKKRFLQVRSWK